MVNIIYNKYKNYINLFSTIAIKWLNIDTRTCNFFPFRQRGRIWWWGRRDYAVVSGAQDRMHVYGRRRWGSWRRLHQYYFGLASSTASNIHLCLNARLTDACFADWSQATNFILNGEPFQCLKLKFIWGENRFRTLIVALKFLLQLHMKHLPPYGIVNYGIDC